MKNKKAKIVHDSQGNQYQLTAEIGRGGQGIVCATDRADTLVKLCLDKSPEAQARWQQQVQWCLRQGLSDLNLALPKIAIVRPKSKPGYVMELMDGLMPLSKVLEQSVNGMLADENAEEYRKTGGVARRIKLLLHIASILSQLHSRGYAYGDLSPANIFVSERVSDAQVWFIDCENLCFDEREGVSHFYTPGYGAPEVVKGEQNANCLSDTWSFAVLAFELLTHQHPFFGEQVENGDPDEVEPLAFAAELPWVYDQSDDSNCACGGIDMDLVVNLELKALFGRCFEEGKRQSLKRPSMSQWRQALQQAHDQLIECPHCHHSYFYQANAKTQVCPFCDGSADDNAFVVFEQVLLDTENDQVCRYPLERYRVLNFGKSLAFNIAPYGTELWHQCDDTLIVQWREDELLNLIPQNRSQITLARGKKQKSFRELCELPRSKNNRVFELSSYPPCDDEIPPHKTSVQTYHWQFKWGRS